MHKKYLFVLVLMGTLSCGEVEAPATSSPSSTTAGTLGTISLSLTPAETPHAGENIFRVCLAALPGGEALASASISLQTWMPSMGHGGPAVPAPSGLGAGCYRAAVVFPMPGLWELRVQAKDSTREDSATFSYDIP